MIAVSGTPGTGKSIFAKILAKRLKARLVELNALIFKGKFYTLSADGTRVVDVLKMRKAFTRELPDYRGSVVVEGLLAHLLPKSSITHVVVLRTRPKVLEHRLRRRGYVQSKIRDNVESEALDIILWEAVEAHGVGRVYEIDTTGLKPAVAVKLFIDALDGKASLKPGKITWLEEVF